MIDTGLNGKTAVITGANNPFGIGAATARALAAQGVNVFLHYYRHGVDFPVSGTGNEGERPGLYFFFEQQMKDAGEVIDSIRSAGAEAAAIEGDLRDERLVKKIFDEAEKRFGSVDILVNNAAEYMADTFLPAMLLKDEKPLWENGPVKSAISRESFDRHFSVNALAASLMMAAFARRQTEQKRNWGRIINISADCAWGSPGEISYRASKYALESYSRSAAAELGPYGITVNIVSPGPVQTGYISRELEEAIVQEIPAGRIGRPEDIANTVLFLASEQAGWITGQLIFVHGGHRMALGQ